MVAVAIQHAVLSFLADGPSYGYEIKTNFEKAVGPQWGGLNIGHVYQILERLSRDGLVTSRTVSQDVRPDRTVYKITAAGRRELDSWLAEPTTRTAGYRDDFILKVLAAGRRSEEQVHEVCRTQRDARMAELQTLRALRRQHKDEPLAALTIEAAILGVQADLKLIEVAVRQRLPPAAGRHARPTPGQAGREPPRRRTVTGSLIAASTSPTSITLVTAIGRGVVSLLVAIGTQVALSVRESNSRRYQRRRTALIDAQDAALAVRGRLSEYGTLSRANAGRSTPELDAAERRYLDARALLEVTLSRVDDRAW